MQTRRNLVIFPVFVPDSSILPGRRQTGASFLCCTHSSSSSSQMPVFMGRVRTHGPCLLWGPTYSDQNYSNICDLPPVYRTVNRGSAHHGVYFVPRGARVGGFVHGSRGLSWWHHGKGTCTHEVDYRRTQVYIPILTSPC